MTTPIPLVLVHGAWAGAWAWRRVRAPLAEGGRAVHAVTLTGCGERRHLLRRDITLQTHVADVVGLVEAEELGEVVLVGHSYAGTVITGAADALMVRGIARVRQLVYVDANVPRPGEAWGSRHDEATRAQRLAAALATGLNVLPAPDPADFGLADADRDWLRRRQGPHPFGAYLEPLHFDEARWAALPRAFIDCVSPAYPTIAATRRRVRETPGVTVVEMASGHYPQIQVPAEFVHVLRGLLVG